MATGTATVPERFSAAMHHCSRAWKVALDRRLRHLGLSMAAWMTVAMTAKAEGPLSQADLAQAVGVEGATMVAMIDKLMKAGLVERKPSSSDRRINHIVLTPEGLALYAKVKAEADAFRHELLSDIDEALLLKATELLERLRTSAEAAK